MSTALVLASGLASSACAVQPDDSDVPGGGGKADDSSSACASPEVRRMQRPTLPGSAKSPSFSYAYRVVKGTDPTAPVIIYLPGGPGQTSIDGDRAQLAIPERYTVVMTDPRGVGCNAPPQGTSYADEFYTDEFYTTDNIASDVVAMLHELQPDAYMLYGISYGTLLGTVTAFQAEAEGIPPQAVVLEGVVSRAFAPGEEAAEYPRQWNDALARLAPEVRSQLTGSELPLGLTADEWGGAISTMLSVGEITGTGNLLDLNLSALAPGTPADVQAQLRAQLLGFAAMAKHSTVSANMLHLFERVACREIAETNFDTLTLSRGALVPVGDVCAALGVTEPYHAANYPLATSIFYINGTRDPNTPHAFAKEHMAAQRQTSRAFISVIDGGHNPFSLNLMGCAPALWEAFERDGAGLARAVATCEAPTELAASPAS